MLCTSPDLSHSISLMSRFISNPCKQRWKILKRILRYLKGTKDIGILFKRVNGRKWRDLEGYVDGDYAFNLDNMRSQTCFVFIFFATTISWKSNLHHVVALSTTKVEFMAVIEVNEGIWLLGLIAEFGVVQEFVEVRCDNYSAIHLVKHVVFHERSKHMDVRLHFVIDLVDKGVIQVQKMHTY